MQYGFKGVVAAALFAWLSGAASVSAYDMEDLPENPSVAQQIEAGQHNIDEMRVNDVTFDSNAELRDYFNDIAAKLVAASGQTPACPIQVHIGSVLVVNAEAMMGGQIVVFEDMFDTSDNEAQLAAMIAHEVAHQLNGDSLARWRLHKEGKYKNALILSKEAADLIRKQEIAADENGTRLMYAAGWDPEQAAQMHRRIEKLQEAAHRGFGMMAHGIIGKAIFVGLHPPEDERAKDIEKVIASLPPKPGLIKDSPRFDELKAKY